MKILHIIYSLRNGGAERILIDLVKGLNARGHENQICTIIPKNFFKPELDHYNISYNNLLNKEKIRFIPYLPLIMLKLKNQVKIFKPDIIHTHLRNDSIACLLINENPIIRTFQNSIPFKASPSNEEKISISTKILIKLEKLSILKKNFHLVACNDTSQKIINTYLTKYNKNCNTVITNAIDLSRIKKLYPNDYSTKKSTIIMVGTLYKTKNQIMGIYALRKIIDEGFDVELQIIGDGQDKLKLISIANKLNILDRVKFLGKVENVQDHLKKATIYWSTSLSEGFSIANLEAMAMGIPIIATDVDGNSEMLKNFKKHCLVKLNKVDALANNSIRLIKDRDLLIKLGQEIKDYTYKNYSLDKFVNRYLDLYNCALKN